MPEPQYDFTGIAKAHDAFTSRFELRQAYDFTGIAPAEPDKPEATVRRWFDSLVKEGPKDWARGVATSRRLHSTYGSAGTAGGTDSQVEANRLSPMQRARIADKLSEQYPDVRGPIGADKIQESTRDVILQDRQDSIVFWKEIEELPFLQTAPEFEGPSSGFGEDVLRSGSASLLNMPFLAIPILGQGAIYSHMHGAMAEGLAKQGVPEKRAHKAASISAAISTPMEAIGDLLQIKAMFPGSGKWLARGLLYAEAMLGESGTEYFQQYPETALTIWALNPDLSPTELTRHMGETFASIGFQKEALYSGAIGGVSAGATVGAVQGTVSLADHLLSSKQRRINKEKGRRFSEILNKDNPTTGDVQELAKLVGMPAQTMETLTKEMEADESIKETVEKIRARVMFQSDPIKSESRDRIQKAVSTHRNFTKEQANAYMAIWDGIAYSMVESGDIKSPGEFYDMWRFEAGGKSEGRVANQTAFHGTPHVWPPEPGFPHGRPRLDKIGTGEGGAAYGWGWYSAEIPDTAKTYVPRDFDLEDAFMEQYKLAEKAEDYDKMEVYEAAMMHETPAELRERFEGRGLEKHIKKIGEFYNQSEGGQLYTLDIPDDVIPKLLDWDAPLSEQPEAVKKALSLKVDADGRVKMPNGERHPADRLTGERIYRAISEGKFSPKAASEYLASIGIPGNKYLDQGSRPVSDTQAKRIDKMRAAVAAMKAKIKNPPSWTKDQEGIVDEWRSELKGMEANLKKVEAGQNITRNFVIWDQKALDRVALLERNGEKLDAMQAAFSKRRESDTAIPMTSKQGAGENKPTGQNPKAPVGGKKYPIAPRDEWWGDADYEQRGGKIVTTTPDTFLSAVRPLEIDEESRENIDLLKEHIESGKTLDPAVVYLKDGKVTPGDHDGRHRAVAAKELGIVDFPVLLLNQGFDTAPVASNPFPTGKTSEPVGGVANIEGIVKSLKRRGVKGDALLDAEDLANDLFDGGGIIDADGMVTLYHRTNQESAQEIAKSGYMTGKEDRLFFGTLPEGQINGYGDAVVEVTLPLEKLELNDVFTGEAHVTYKSGRPGTRNRIAAKLWPGFNQSTPPTEAGDRTAHQDKRGLIENLFTDEPAIMRAFASADPSTPIHETGHLLTKILWKSRPKDYNAIAEWAGVDADRAGQGLDAWTDDELEKVARGFERYIMEGRAPTMRLQAVFRKLKQWLIQIYKTVKTLDVEISDEVRQVFDRLVSTEEERANDPVYEVLEWFLVDDPAFSTPSESDLSEYANIAAKARRLVVGRLQDQRRKDEKKLTAEFRRTAKEMVEELDIYAVMNDIVAEGGLHYDTIKARHGQGTIEDLLARRPGIVSHTGVEPDQAANAWGYDTADDMISDILRSESKAKAEERLYNDMWAEYEQSLTEDHVDVYDWVLDAEIDIINEMMGKKKPKARTDLKPIIRKETGQVKPADYRQLRDDLKRDEKVARDAYREAMRNIKERDHFEKAKRHQQEFKKRLAHLREVSRLKHKQKKTVAQIRQQVKDTRERAKINRRMKRYLRMKPKSLPVDYMEQVVGIMGRYFVLPKKYKNMAPQESLESLLERAEAEGENVDVPRMIARDKLPGPRGSGETMDIENLKVVAQLIDSIVHLGKTKGKLISGKQKQDLEEVVNRLVTQIFDAHDPDPEQTPWEIIDARRKKLASVKEQARTFFAQIEKPEFILRALDGWEDLGPVWTEIFKRLKGAEDHEMTLGAEYTEKMKAAFDRAGANRKWANEEFEIEIGPEGEERTETRRKEELIMIALNSGNEGNRAALTGGYGFTEEQIDAVWNMLSDTEKQLVNDVWNIIDGLFPILEDVHLKHTGARLAKVEGRYFPLIFDRDLSLTADKFAQERELKDLFASEYHMTKPEWGHRKERRGGKMAPRLEFAVIQQHLQKTIHDIAHQLPIRDAQRIIAHPQFRNAVSRTLGKEVYAQLLPWLQNIARPRIEPISQIDKWVGKIRRNTTTVALGLKVSVALKQQLSLTQTVDAVGLGATLAGMKEFYTDPRGTIERVNAISPAMRFRRNSWDRELRQHYEQFDALSIGWTDTVRDAYFSMIQLMDLMATYPSWLAGFSKGMGKFNDREQAIEFADMVVRTTQPAASPKDLSWIQRGGKTRTELHKSLTMFYTFFAIFQNRMTELHRRFGAGDINTVELLKSYWWMVVAPAILGGVISRGGVGDDGDEPKDIAKTIAKDIIGYRVAGVPYVRDFVSGFMSDYGYSLSPIEGAGKSVEYFGKGLPKMDPRKSVKGAIKVGGYAFGLPAAQINITLDGVLDLASGETDDASRLLFSKRR